MRDCLELIGNIIAVHIFPLGTVSFPMPFNVRVTQINAADITLNGEELSLPRLKATRCIALEDYIIYNESEKSVVAEPGISVKETSKNVAAGTYYTTKISCKTYDPIEEVRQMVYDFSSVEAFDVFLVDSADRVFLLRGVEPATSIDLAANLPVSSADSIDVQVVSVNGLLRVNF